jgi:hypothetical protein
MNGTRLRGLAVAGSDAVGRKSPHNHAQTVRNVKRSLRNAAAGARLIRLIQVEGWIAIRLPTSQHPLLMHSKSFTGWSGASTDAFDVSRVAFRRAHQLASCTEASGSAYVTTPRVQPWYSPG